MTDQQVGKAVEEALLRSREARHVSPPERGSEDWRAWEGDAGEDADAVVAAIQPFLVQPSQDGALREDAYCVEEFIGKVTEWNGTDEDEQTEAKEAAERLTAALDPAPEARHV